MQAMTLNYKYCEGHWSPLNQNGKKVYDINLLMQIKESPLSQSKPNIPLKLNHILKCHNIRTTSTALFSRSVTDAIMPSFLKDKSARDSQNNALRDGKNNKPPINLMAGRENIKLMPNGSGNSERKTMIHISLSVQEDIKLNETENAWRPTRFQKLDLDAEELKTQVIFKKFRGILNKLTPENFNTLMEKVEKLEINTQKRLEGVIDLVFEKAIEEPNFNETYAAMCNKLSSIRVPVDNAQNAEQNVNFRGLLLSRCQKQFMTEKVDEVVTKLQNELSECTDPTKKKELQIQLEEQNRRIRMRAVGNVRFIGELYKLKMLNPRIMLYCINTLLEKLEEEKLECLCKLLTTIGERVESDLKDQLDNVFKKMQDIANRRDRISSRLRFMILDVITLRERKWVQKSFVDLKPKMLDQIQEEAEQQQRHVELMNIKTTTKPNYRDDHDDDNGDRERRGNSRRQNSNAYMDDQWTRASSRPTNFTIDISKFKAVTQKTKDVSDLKLMPNNSVWKMGSSVTKNKAHYSSSHSNTLAMNKFSILDNLQSDSQLFRGQKLELKSTENNNRSKNQDSNTPKSFLTSSKKETSSCCTSVIQRPLPEQKIKSVNSTINLYIINLDDAELVADVKHHFESQYHASVVKEICNIALEKSQKEIKYISKALSHLIISNTISPENFISGVSEIFELAPDLLIDIPKVYEYLGLLIAPVIEKKRITFKQVLDICAPIISARQGHYLLESILKTLTEIMGPLLVESKWLKSELHLKHWMAEDQIPKWIEANKFEFLNVAEKSSERKKNTFVKKH